MQQNLFVYNQNTGNVILIKPTARKKKLQAPRTVSLLGLPSNLSSRRRNILKTGKSQHCYVFHVCFATQAQLQKICERWRVRRISKQAVTKIWRGGGHRAQLLFFITVRSEGGMSAFPWSGCTQAATWAVTSIQPQRRDTLATTSTPGFETSLQHRFNTNSCIMRLGKAKFSPPASHTSPSLWA